MRAIMLKGLLAGNRLFGLLQTNTTDVQGMQSLARLL